MTNKIPAVSGVELVRVLERIGFVIRRQKGSHVHLFREADKRRTTVPVHRGRNIPIGTLKAILKDVDVTAEQLRELL